MSGELPKVYREILRAAVAPVYWLDGGGATKVTVMANGTMTFVSAGEHILGVTALHVLDGYQEASRTSIRAGRFMSSPPPHLG